MISASRRQVVAPSAFSLLAYFAISFFVTQGGVSERHHSSERPRGKAAMVGSEERKSPRLGYLIPVVRGGANNQLGDIASAITVAAKLQRDIILPPLQGHKSEPGGAHRSQHLTEVWNISQLDTGDTFKVDVHSLAAMQSELKTLDVALVGCITKRLPWTITVGPPVGTTVPVSIPHWGKFEARSVHCFDDNIGVKEGSRNGSHGVATAFADHGVTAFPIIMVAWGHIRHSDRKREVVHLLRSIRFTNDILLGADAYLRSFRLMSDDGGLVRPYIGVHARRGDFATYCNKAKFDRAKLLRASNCRDPARAPVLRNRSTCYPSPQLIGATVAQLVSLQSFPCLRHARDVVVATNERSRTPFWAELSKATLGGSTNLRRMHSFKSPNGTSSPQLRTLPGRNCSLDDLGLSPLQQSVVEQGVMIRSCAFIGNVASSWSRMVMHYREAWKVNGTCRYIGQGMTPSRRLATG